MWTSSWHVRGRLDEMMAYECPEHTMRELMNMEKDFLKHIANRLSGEIYDEFEMGE